MTLLLASASTGFKAPLLIVDPFASLSSSSSSLYSSNYLNDLRLGLLSAPGLQMDNAGHLSGPLWSAFLPVWPLF